MLAALTSLLLAGASARAEHALEPAVREVLARLAAGELERAHRLALAIPDPKEARARFAIGHLHQRVAGAMERAPRPSPVRSLHFPPGSPPREDACDPRRAAWWRGIAEHRRRFERLVPPARAHGRGSVNAELAHDLACAGDLRAARAELARWRSEWAAWQRAWYAFLDGDLGRAARELDEAGLARRIDPAALARTRLMLAALGRDEPRRRALCAAGVPAGVPASLCAAEGPRPARLAGRLHLPGGASGELLLFPEAFANSAIGGDPYRVYRNLSFFHQRARVRRDGSFLFPRVVPGGYRLLARVTSEHPLLAGGAAELTLLPGERRRLELRVQAIRSAGSTGSR